MQGWGGFATGSIEISNILTEAAALLTEHYGEQPLPGPPGEWLTLVRIVLEGGRTSRKALDVRLIEDSPLANPGDTLDQSVAVLAELLEAAKQPSAKAKTLHELARWWQRHFESALPAGAEVVQIFGERSLEFWQRELREIPGVNWELADRILLFVGGHAVYPLDRGSLRIAARHGWVDVAADYEEWQSFFGSAARDGLLDLRQLSRWQLRVGHEFCKARPNCEECPLRSLLPARGVVEIGEE
jgi:endonuclease-3 related protein